MRKHLIILIVLVIGFVVFQGFIGYNQKQERQEMLKEKTIIASVESREIISYVDEEGNIIFQMPVGGPVYTQPKTLLSMLLPDYSKLNTVEMLVNISFLLGIIVCLLKMKLLKKVMMGIEIVALLIATVLLTVQLIDISIIFATILCSFLWLFILGLIIMFIEEEFGKAEFESSDECLEKLKDK